MADSRVFQLNSGVTAVDVAHAIEDFFETKKGLISEVLETPDGVIVQAKPKENWKKFVGMDNSVQVQIHDQSTSIIVNIGSGKWIDKAGAAAVGYLVFAPLAITAAIGAWNNKKLPEEIFDVVERFIVSGGKRASVTLRASNAIAAGEVVCPKCKTKNQQGTKFCNSCGEKLLIECPSCGTPVAPGAKFCNSCGTNVAEALRHAHDEAIVKCVNCGTVIPDGTKFCPECGTPAPVKLEAGTVACPKCRAILPEGTKFCPECGGAIPQKTVRKCANCGIELKEGAKFCPECGTAT